MSQNQQNKEEIRAHLEKAKESWESKQWLENEAGMDSDNDPRDDWQG